MMQQDSAEALALRALAWMASEQDVLHDFLAATGASADDVARRAAEPDFLASVLDFLLQEDRWIMAFCESAGLSYGMPARARHALPGGAVGDWT